MAAVRFHGYYQSTDGIQWTRLAAQPGANLTSAMCPTRSAGTGSTACPIYRGALAVNPLTGDTFAWTVDLNDQDQGIWQDVCGASSGACTNSSITFGKQWDTSALETDEQELGSATIQNGNYNLTLAAIPSSQDTILLAGANDLWQCSLAMACKWRNTTNSTVCMSAQVGEYQHALTWNPSNPLELFIGNDSGLWRSTDGIGETGSVCAASDADHFQNLNGALGSLAEVESMSPVGASPYTMILGLGANGSAGVKSTSGPTADWPQILGGEGGPVAIDPSNSNNWYVNNGVGVSIHLCSQAGSCTPADFGASPAVSNSDVSGDGLTMSTPAPFLVDPADPTQLLIGTCRVWRGPANGTAWTSANAISPMFDGNRGSSYCSGNALLRSMAAMALSGGGEVVYLGTYGTSNGGATLPGHVLTATLSPSGTWSSWNDLTLNPVTNDQLAFNQYRFDISSIFIDPHDPTGNTIYVTVEGMPIQSQDVRVVYRSSDGGAHWSNIRANLPKAPASSLVVDPVDAATVYIATDLGVFFTQNVTGCAAPAANCWSAFGTGLPLSPVVALSAAPTSTLPNVLVAATFGRGVWQIPLATAGTQLTTVSISDSSLDFGTVAVGSSSTSKTLSLTNTGGVTLQPGGITASGDFTLTDPGVSSSPPGCSNAAVNAGASCAIQLVFRPSQTGLRTGQLSIAVNVAGSPVTVALTGNGVPPPVVNLSPATVEFGQVEIGTKSASLQITAENSGATAVAISGLTVSGPFILTSNSCGATSLAAKADCQLTVVFQPVSAGAATGALTLVDDAGTQSVQLSGTGAAPPTDTLSITSLAFPDTIIGQSSPAQSVTLTNSGDLALTSIVPSITPPGAPFQIASNNCTTQLAARSSCSIAIAFTPAQSGTQTGTLTLSDVLHASQQVSLSGTGLLPPAFSASPASLAFPAQTVGVASTPSTLTVTNSGGASLANVGFAIAGPSASSFSTGATTCGAALTAAASCTIQVIFTPAASGGSAATLTISSSTLGVKPLAVPITGTSQTTAGLNVSPTQLSFAAQAIGQPSAPQTVTISNAGPSAADGLSITVSGPFSLTQNTCATSLAAGSSCTTGIIFIPSAIGTLTGVLTVSASNVTPPATVVLNGIGGLTGAVQILPGSLNFPTTGVATTSNPITVTITNAAAGAALGNLTLSVSSGFKLVNNTCADLLAAGASCTTGVAFAPTSSGAQSGALTVASTALAAAATVPLSGVGFDFQATASGTASVTVAAGQTASFPLAVAPSGSSASFTFQCGTLPSYAACTFNPSTATLSAGSAGTVTTLQVTTSQATSALLHPTSLRAWPALPVAFCLALLPLRLLRRKAFLPVLLLALAAIGFGGCSSSGGGSGGTTPPPPPATHTTPAGTYTIQVTVTADGVQHTVPLTLVVD